MVCPVKPYNLIYTSYNDNLFNDNTECTNLGQLIKFGQFHVVKRSSNSKISADFWNKSKILEILRDQLIIHQNV